MDTRWKKYSHSMKTKSIVFIVMIACFTGIITLCVKIDEYHEAEVDIVFEDSYFKSDEYTYESGDVVSSLAMLIEKYKSEGYILSGQSIDKSEVEQAEDGLYSEFQWNSKYFNPNLTNAENHEKFKEVYAYELSQIKKDTIQNDLEQYEITLKVLEGYKDVIYYASDGEVEFTNSLNKTKDYFKTFSSFMVFDEEGDEVYPKEIEYSKNYWIISPNSNMENRVGEKIYIAYDDDYLNSNIKEWKEAKESITKSLFVLALLFIGFLVSFIYLIIVVGRKFFKDKELHLNLVDKIYSDINLEICFGLIILWLLSVSFFFDSYKVDIYRIMIPITTFIATLGFILILSLVKKFKNKTLLKHTLIFTFYHKVFQSIKSIYDSGSVGSKILLIVIGYPILVSLTFFIYPLTFLIYPLTIAFVSWLALKQVNKFNEIKEGVEKIKNGDIHYILDTKGKGELAILATNINEISNGLKEAVDNELKSERLKTELITNVSHDIRTPLTSIITYVDLLKIEKDQSKSEEYIEIISQKSQRLKDLTDDLFEASKASSGSIPVNYEKIDIISLIKQGLGELNDKIEKKELKFKINEPKEKLFIEGDGKLLWRAIENLLSNIFKYAESGSRVYLDVEDLENEVKFTIKNISAYELNISTDELMERFKRGDESRSSQGSGLGLSIAKSLIDIQKGNFAIEIDGDLFKAIIKMPKHKK
ncbi:HAMP domain-containing sensor histidine kinase [Clostridium grantii]|uniref:histidine kinase n=1 Tax=Clostridium grantii DSM 8605 TaxID=1121316 RepID=A0A1M5SZ18_9CLOT|nr:HAMP domain-containing sensor histidine kinase [Clostridium grantii]SHH43767.1 Signal transduction histidine kinase [Clostridium grantii DSM 8605]